MKILHTGDWHIGKLVHGIHMTDDQRFIINNLMTLIKKERPDAMVIAGDLYDRSVPPIEAVELLDEVLTEIVTVHKVKVIVIAGNHDSPDRVGFGSKMLRDNGLYISGHISKNIEPVILEDAFGPVNFYLVPFAEPAIVRAIYEDDGIKTHDDGMKATMSGITSRMAVNQRNVCVAHAFLMGTESITTSDSVRPLSIGGSEYVDAGHFESFDYTALGHLHRPQKVINDRIRYSGSLLKYSFSEATQLKSVTMIELDDQGEIEVELHQLEPVRDMRVIKGKLENLVDIAVYGESNTDDYIMAVLTDDGELIDPISSLRSVYPNVLRVEKESYQRVAGEELTSASEHFKQKNTLELFQEFYENISGELFDDEKKVTVAALIDDINKKGRVS